MNRIRVLMTTTKLGIGGAETHIVEVAKALSVRGTEITVASNGGVFEEELERHGIRHIRIPLHTKHPLKVLRSYLALKKLIREETFDIIHAHARIPAVLCGILARKYHIRFVTTAHLTFAVNALWRRLSDWGERSIAVSDDIKEYLIEEYGMCADNISVTINGINMDTYAENTDFTALKDEMGLEGGKRRVVLVSRMDTDRSLAAMRLAEIAPRLHERYPDIELLLVGSGNDYDRVRQTAERANAACGTQVVRLAGARTDINCCIASGEIFVGVSRAVLEAMSMAKPVILAGNEGYLGIFEREKFAVAYDSNFCCRGCAQTEADALYEDLLTLLDMSDADRRRLGEANREIIRTHYSVERMAEDYLQMYRRVKPYAYTKWGDILISGYYGFHNTGDDSLLSVIVENLRKCDPDVKITVMSKKPEQTKKIYGTQSINRFSPVAVCRAMRHGKILINGGGNLLQDSSSGRSLLYYTFIMWLAKRYGLRQMVYANGIGPLSDPRNQRLVKKRLTETDVITIREPESISQLAKLGLTNPDIILTADPAFCLEEPPAEWTARLRKKFGMEEDRAYFAVALRAFRQNHGKNCRAVAGICDRISQQYGLTPVFFPMHTPLDLGVTQEVMSLCRYPCLLVSNVTGREMMGLLRGMRFCMAMRLHTLIYASAVSVPAIGICYDAKIEAFLRYMGTPFVTEAENIREQELFALAGEVLENREKLSGHLMEKGHEMRALAEEDARRALALLRNEK